MKVREPLMRETVRVYQTALDWRHLLGDNGGYHAMCLKVESILHIIHCLKRSVCPQWDSLLDLGLAFVSAGVRSCSDDVTHHSSANFKCVVADVNNAIPVKT